MYNVVVGGGITGIFCAHFLKKNHPDIEVVIIERASRLGGLLKSIEYGKFGKFDYGVHTFYETGIGAIDEFFVDNEPDSGWKFQEGYQRDLGGCIWDGNINFKSPYLDLRALPYNKISKYRSEVIKNLKSGVLKRSDDTVSALDFLENRFGKSLTNDYLATFISARHHIEAEKVHKLSAKIQQLTRAVLFDFKELFEDNQPRQLCEISAFPDQLDYPQKFLTSKRTFYPKQVGIDQAVNALTRQLTAEDIKILTGSQVSGVTVRDNLIQNLDIVENNGKEHVVNAKNVIWTVPLSHFFGHIFPVQIMPKFDPPKRTVIVNIVTSELPNSNGLYWLLSHGHKFIHRISFPDNYSEPLDKKTHKICIECIFNQNASLENLNNDVVQFIYSTNMITDPTKIVLIDAVDAPGGFPNLSIKNIQSIQKIRDQIEEEDIKNFFNVGILSRDDMFFQFDLIKNSYEQLSLIS